MPKYLATGDLHVGAGRALYPERLAEQQQVWQRILDLAGEEGCAAVLFAGDAFHRNAPDDDERQAFMVPLLSSSVPVFAINGNSHDWRGHGRKMAVETAALGAGVLTVSTSPEVLPLPGGESLCTLPWTPVARLVAEAGGGDRDELNMVAAQLLVEAARGLRARVEGAAVLMAHWSVSGSVTPSGLAVEPHVFREPVLNLGDLAGLDFDAFVLGHIHTPGPFAGLLQPPLFYVGSPMPLDFSEGGVEHGCWILELDDDLGAHIEFVPIASTPFETLRWNHDDDPDVEAEVRSGDHSQIQRCEGAAVRAIVTTSDALLDAAAIQRGLVMAGARYARVTVEREKPTRPSRGAPVDGDLTAAQQLDQWLRDAGVNGDEGARLVERGSSYLEGIA